MYQLIPGRACEISTSKHNIIFLKSYQTRPQGIWRSRQLKIISWSSLNKRNINLKKFEIIEQSNNLIYIFNSLEVFFNFNYQEDVRRTKNYFSNFKGLIYYIGSGIGYYTIALSKTNDNVRSFEINPFAVYYQVCNSIFNRVNSTIIMQDAYFYYNFLKKVTDKIIIVNMPQEVFEIKKSYCLKIIDKRLSLKKYQLLWKVRDYSKYLAIYFVKVL